MACAGAALAALVAALGAAPALAHLTVEPPSIEVGGKQRFALIVHNDRDEVMTGFRLVAPPGLQILGTGGASGWNEVVEGATATWWGGRVAADTPATFEADLEATTQEPGPAELEGVQLYADGESVTWPFTLTVLPVGGSVEEGGGGLGASAVAVFAVLAVVLTGLIALLIRQRRRTPSG
jgi:hypothetical protein